MSKGTGQCLCGKVTFSADFGADIQACHCVQCQKWTGGGPYYAVRANDLKIDGETRVKAYHASQWGERAFCESCGSTLYWTLQGEIPTSVAAGLLDHQSGLRVSEEIYIDYRPDWMPEWPDAKQETEVTIVARLNEYLEGKKQ